MHPGMGKPDVARQTSWHESTGKRSRQHKPIAFQRVECFVLCCDSTQKVAPNGSEHICRTGSSLNQWPVCFWPLTWGGHALTQAQSSTSDKIVQASTEGTSEWKSRTHGHMVSRLIPAILKAGGRLQPVRGRHLLLSNLRHTALGNSSCALQGPCSRKHCPVQHAQRSIICGRQLSCL